MANETVFFTPENNGGSVPAWLAANGGGFGNGFGGLGGGILGFLLGLFFGNGWGGFGGFGNGGSGAGFLSNQINNDNGRDLLMAAINSNGEASRAAIQNLATMLGQDFNLVNSGVQGIREGIASLAAQTGMSSLQIINAIQSGNTALGNQLQQCCCNMKTMVMEQGYQGQIATLNQTNQLGAQADRNANAIISAINAQTVAMNDQFCQVKERELQNKIDSLLASNTALKSQIDNLNQTNAFAALLAPINAKLVQIESRQPSTVPVIYPNLVATPVTPATTTGA